MYKKYLILLGFILAIGYSAFAAAAPNSCDNPTAITYTTGVQKCVAGSNTGAAAGPDFNGNNCYDFPSETYWYEVTTTGSSATIDILLTSATLTSPYFSVFTTTDCANYTIVNCTQGTSGSASNTVSISTNTTYLIAVSDQNGLDGNFNLCITVNDDNSACNTNNVLSVTATSMGSPLAGPYQAGEIVSFCYSITNYQQINCNYLQGIVPTFGDCWDPVSFTAQGAPVTITTPLATAAVLANCPPGPPCAWNACEGDPAGTWSWFPAGSAIYNNINNPSIPNGTSIGAGWFFLTTYSPTTGSCTADPTDPDNSYGDGSLNCGENTYDWTVCFQLQTRTDGVTTCFNGLTDCSVSIKTYADGEIGVWDNVGCLADISSASPSTIYACCAPTPAVYNVSGGGTLCSGEPGVSINLSDSENGVTYELYLNGVATGTTVSGTGSAISFTNQTAAGTYTVAAVIDATSCGDLMTGSTTIIVSGTAPTVTVNPASSSICSGQSVALTATVTPSPATLPATFTNTNDFAIPDNDQVTGISSTIDVSGITPTTVGANPIVRVCLNIDHTRDDNLDISLLCPGGTAINLSSDNGGGGDNYTGTCFVSTGTAITAGTVPFTGDFVPEQAFTGLNACNINGTWTLKVFDDAGNGSTGTLRDWSIAFNSPNTTTFSWSPTTDMTGSGTLTPTVSPTSTTAYTISATDQTGCSAISTTNITVSPAITLSTSQTNVACFGNSTGAVNLTVSGGTSPFIYIWTGGAVTQDLSGVVAGTYSVTVTDDVTCTNTTTVTLTQPASALTASITGSNVACFGDATGSATLVRGGGTPPYTYAWSSGPTTQNLTNIVAGNYTVTVTDANSCTITASVTISEPATALSTVITGTDNDCFGNKIGVATSTTNGGTTPYSYDWDDPLFQTTANATGLYAGTYNVTVTDANGCTTTGSVVISEPAQINLTSVITNSNCGSNDGAVNLSVSGGVSPFGYSWTGPSSFTASTQDINTLYAGTYNVTLTDANNCTATHTANVTDVGAPTANITSSTNVSCNAGNDGSATVTISGTLNPPYDYVWSTTTSSINDALTTNTETGLSAGTVSVTVTDNVGCQANASVSISEPSVLNLSITAQTNVSCNTGNDGSATVSVSGGTAGYTYLWNDPAPAQTTATVSALTAGIFTVTVTDTESCTSTTSVTITEPALLTVSSSEVNVSCNSLCDASSTANPSGGTSPYTYLWNDGAAQNSQTAINLCDETYNVTVTDNENCTETITVTITEPVVLSASIVGTMPSCNGSSDGIANLSVVGGSSPYTYIWSTTATTEDINGLVAGIYTVTITDINSCQTTASVTISEPAVLTSSISVTNVSCNGDNDGATDLTVSGGTTPYSFVWSNGATTEDVSGLVAAPFYVTITDSEGCVKLDSIIITEPVVLSASILGANLSCNLSADGVADLSVNGGTFPFTYLWSNAATIEDISNLTIGNYDVTVTDNNGCQTTASVTLTEPAVLTPTIIGNDVSCNAGTNGTTNLSVSGGTTPYSYLWDDSGASTTEDLSGLSAGIYNVTVTDVNGCIANSSVTITEPLVLSAAIAPTHVLCSGNKTGAANLTVSGGSSPFTFLWDSGETTEDISNLFAGVYCVTVTDNNSCTTSECITLTEPAAPISANIIATNVSCNGGNDGATDLTVSGGTSPYSFLWDDVSTSTTEDISGLSVGIYSVAITDANLCSMTSSVTITQPASALSASILGTNLTCNTSADGVANLNVTGGTTPYSYLWDDSGASTTEDLSGLTAGISNVTVTDVNGCIANSSVTLTEPSVIVLTPSSTSSSCGNSDGSASVAVAGGTTPYSYIWDDLTSQTAATATGLPAGSYSVTVTDNNGCLDSLTINISDLGAPTIIANVFSNVACNGLSNGSAYVEVTSGTSPFTYLWSYLGQINDTAINLPAGNYSVSVYDPSSCLATASVTITEPNILFASIVGTNVSCNLLSDGEANLTVSGGTTPYTFAWSNLATTEDISGLSANTYDVTVTDLNSCTANTDVTITEPAVLNASITSQTDVDCNGNATGSATVTASGGTSGYSYDWSPNGFTGDGTVTYSALTVGIYNVTVTDANLCTTTVSATITEPAAVLSASITSQTNVDCNGNATGSATVTASGGTSGYSYDWSPNGFTGDGTVTYSALTDGIYTVTVTDANLCTTTTSATITEPVAVLSASITSQTNVDCNGNSNGSLTVTVSGGTSGYAYDWSPNGFTGDGTNTYSALPAGNYTVTIIDVNLCTTTAFATITEPVAVLSASITSQTDVDCNGNSNGSLTVTALGGTSGYAYDWSPNGFTGDGTVTYSALTDGIYTVTLTDANLCTTTTSATITEPAQVIADAGVNETICIGDAISLTASGGSSYSWSNAEITATISVTPITDTTFYVTVTDAIGCIGYDSVKVFVNLLPNADAGIDVAFCEGDSVTLTASGGTGYLWSDLAGNTASVVVKPTSPQYYFVTVTDVNGCTDYDSTFVMYNPLPNANAGNNLSICYGNDTILSASGGTFFLWNTTEITSTINVSPLSDSTYYVTVSDVNGCSDVDSVNVVVNLLPLANAGANDTICNGDNITLTASGGTDYLWSNSANTASTIVNPSTETTYIVTITDINGCKDTDDVIITVNALPTPTIIGSLTYCTGGNAILTTESYTDYNWSNGELTQIITADTLDNPLSVTVTDSNGCIGVSGSVNLISSTSLSPVIVGNLSYCAGSSTVLSVGIFTNYEWSSGETTQTINATAGTYDVTVSDASGCSGVSAGVLVVENPNPSPVITGNLSYCEGSNTVLSVGIFDTYNWTTGATTQTINATIADNNPGISVVVTLGSCSTIATPVTVVENPNPTPVISGNLIYCEGSSALLDAGSFSSYLWSNNETTQTINVTYGTYTVSVTNVSNCSALASPVIVTESQNPTPEIIGSLTYCTGFNTTLSTSLPYSSYLWSSTETTSSITATAGTYFITVTNTDGCLGYDTVSVIESNSLSPVISGNLSYCEGSNTTLDAGLYDSYNWSTTETTQTINVSAGTYDVTVFDSFGCSGTTSATVIENANPTPIIYGTLSFCANDSTLLTSSTFSSYLWSNGSSNDSIYATVSDSLITLAVTNTFGCNGADSVVVVANSLPVAFAGVDKNICYGEDTTLTASGGTTFIWSTNETTNTISVSPLSTTIFYVTVTDANGCKDNDEVVVNVNPQLIATISSTDVDCFGNSTGIADLTVSGGTTPYSFAWSNTATTEDISGLVASNYDVAITDSKGCQINSSVTITEPSVLNTSITGVDLLCNSSANGIVDLTVSGGTTAYSFNWSNLAITEDLSGLSGGTYYVTVTDVNNCQKIDSITINEPTALNNTFININNVICSSNTGSATASVTGGVSPYTYLWDSNTGNQDSVTAINLGGGMYYLTITDANNCTKTDSVNISSTPGGTANATLLATNNCFGDNSGSAIASMSGGTSPFSYSWSNTVSTATISNLVAGVYTVTITDANNCMSIDSVTITEPAEIIAIISQTATSCYNGTDGTATVIVSGGTSPYSYLWSDNQTTSVATGLSPNGYYVTVTDSLGCIIDTNISVNNAIIISISESHTNITCKGSNNGSIAVIVNGGTAPYTYNWSSGGNTNTIINVIAGTYTVTVTDFNACTESRVITLTEPALNLQVSVTAVDADCFNENNGEATATVTSGVSPYTYLWSSNSQTTQTATSLLAGYHTVTVTDFSGCNAIGIVNIGSPTQIEVIDSLTVITKTSCQGSIDGKIVVNYSGGTPPYTYYWNNGKTDNEITELTAANYYLTVTDFNNCEEVDTFTVESNPVTCLDIPTAFTPNGDSYNDTWEIKYLYLYPNASIKIFNRWGQLVFECKDGCKPWEGTHNGKPLAFGPFTYIIDLNDGNDPINGVVTLIK